MYTLLYIKSVSFSSALAADVCILVWRHISHMNNAAERSENTEYIIAFDFSCLWINKNNIHMLSRIKKRIHITFLQEFMLIGVGLSAPRCIMARQWWIGDL